MAGRGGQGETSLGSRGFRRLRVFAVRRATHLCGFGSPSTCSSGGRFAVFSLEGLLSTLLG